MRKRITTVLIAFLAIVMSATAQAQNPTSGTTGPLTWKYDTGTKTLTISGKGEMPNYTWKDPAPWEEHKREILNLVVEEGVTGIGEKAFWGAEKLISATLSKTVTQIGNLSFSYCRSLPMVSIPSGVIRIGASAFAHCGNLASITLPAGLQKIESDAFRRCEKLTAVEIPAAVKSIEPYVFFGCSNLPAITVTAGNAHYVSVDGVLFNKEKTQLVQYPAGRAATSYIIPSEVMSIEAGAFGAAEKLTAITIPVGIVSIGRMAFGSCSALTTISIPATVKTIGTNAFIFCIKLAEIKVDAANTAYTSVDGVLFDKVKKTLIKYPEGRNATEYAIPAGVTTIDTYSFAYAKNLASVTLFSSVKAIGEGAFSGCENLKNLTVGMKTPPVLNENDDVFAQVPVANVTLTVPKGSKAAYAAAPVWKEFKQIGESTVGNVALPEARIYAAGGRLYLTLQTAAPVGVYTLNGVLVRTFTAPAGETTVALPQGVYIVRGGERTEKVFVK